MSLSAFGTVPPGVLTTPVPFALDVSHHDQHHLKRLVHDANIGPPSYYTAHTDTTETTSFGLSREWLINAQDVWASHGHSYKWHDEQTHLNSFPNFRINITTSTPPADPNEGEAEEQTFDLHFAALFSQSPTATPLILLHGWPGAWFEFAPLLELLAAKYTPETLPYHVVVPSIPDYGLSTRSRELERELSMDEAAAALDELMVQLGFGDGGYVAQGGDIGSFLAQVMCATFDACRAFHLNLFFLTEAQTAAVAGIPITPAEQVQVDRAADWVVKGTSYGNEHGTRPATISLVLSTNPLAMLAWMGEKFIEWSDNRYPIALNTILSMTSFYWFTESYGRAMWAYRTLMGVIGGAFPTLPFSTTKPFGYSAYHIELGALPKSWAEHLFSNLAFHKSHDKGGHYAALEQPELFLQDLEEFMVIVAGATGSNPGSN